MDIRNPQVIFAQPNQRMSPIMRGRGSEAKQVKGYAWVKVPGEFIEKCSVDEYAMIQGYLNTIPTSGSHSTLVVDLKNAFVGLKGISDTQLDAIIQTGKFYPYLNITGCPDIDSVNVQSRKRKTSEGHAPAKKRQCGENNYERGSNAESPSRETSYQDNANSGRMVVNGGHHCDQTYIPQRHGKNPETSTSNLNYEVEALDVAIDPVYWCYDPASTFAPLAMQQWPYDIENLTSLLPASNERNLFAFEVEPDNQQ
ncbi:a06c7481-0ef2-4a75-8b58-bff5026b315b [Sclerotinia trifoliorum]|uniref:A06c7481-0ef2-4a75-8b58-bff5026b315b n=1 Tax=Sclerotinia trifoliorum TaxID=28548 RepID=A0A8H2VNJ5_9HELO|nr:a06c7481-0ef2-4a75-8b58-bff5026b315b [Sclerotinia trifoliorum]